MKFPLKNGLFKKKGKIYGNILTENFQKMCDKRYKNTVQRHISRLK